jgi:hypothetical protein
MPQESTEVITPAAAAGVVSFNGLHLSSDSSKAGVRQPRRHVAHEQFIDCAVT